MKISPLPKDADALVTFAESIATALAEKQEQLGIATEAEVPLRAAIALIPLIASLLYVRGTARWVRGMDELHRRVALENLAAAFPRRSAADADASGGSRPDAVHSGDFLFRHPLWRSHGQFRHDCLRTPASSRILRCESAAPAPGHLCTQPAKFLCIQYAGGSARRRR